MTVWNGENQVAERSAMLSIRFNTFFVIKIKQLSIFTI